MHEIVRLTEDEFSQLESLKRGELFCHINLQHFGIPKFKINDPDCYAILIKEHGCDTIDCRAEPKLDNGKSIKLNLVKYIHSIPITKIKNKKTIENNPTLLEGTKDIWHSMKSRYCNVRKINEEELGQMDCYIRYFKKL